MSEDEELSDLVRHVEWEVATARVHASKDRQVTSERDLSRVRAALDEIARLLTRARDAGTIPRW